MRAIAIAVIAACGGASHAPAPPSAASLDAVLAPAAQSNFAEYDPAAMIAAVNALLPLGKDGALDALERYAKTHAGDDPNLGLFLVARVAFDTEAFPELGLGGASLLPPADPEPMPRFPIIFLDEVPVMLVGGYNLGGLAPPLSEHLAYYRVHGRLRPVPIKPAASRDRNTAFAALFTLVYGAPPSAAESALVADQLARGHFQ